MTLGVGRTWIALLLGLLVDQWHDSRLPGLSLKQARAESADNQNCQQTPSQYLEDWQRCRPDTFVSIVKCRDQRMHIRCENHLKIGVYKVRLGRHQVNGTSECLLPTDQDDQCDSSCAFGSVMLACHGRGRCRFPVNEETFQGAAGCPAPAVVEVLYTCVTKKVIKKIKSNETFTDHEMCVVPTTDSTEESVAPHFVLRPSAVYQRSLGAAVSLPCLAGGHPEPVVTWGKVGGSFPSSQRTLQEGGNLTIFDLEQHDGGRYECTASNVVTTTVTSTLLLIESFKHSPYHLMVETTANKARASWLAASGDVHYALWYAVEGSDNWQTMEAVPAATTNVTVYSLQPDTSYQFAVEVRPVDLSSAQGETLASNIVTARTRGEEDTITSESPEVTEAYGVRPTQNAFVLGPPRNVKVRRQDQELLVSWSPPAESSMLFTHYAVQYSTDRTVWHPLADQVGTNTLWYRLGTMDSDATYYFQVLACSSEINVCSRGSEVVTIYTGEVEARTVQTGGPLPSEADTWSGDFNMTTTKSTDAAVKEEGVGVVSDWMYTWRFLEENEEKLILYLTIGLAVGFVLLLLVIIVKLLTVRRRKKKKTRLDSTRHVSAQARPEDAVLLDHLSVCNDGRGSRTATLSRPSPYQSLTAAGGLPGPEGSETGVKNELYG